MEEVKLEDEIIEATIPLTDLVDKLWLVRNMLVDNNININNITQEIKKGERISLSLANRLGVEFDTILDLVSNEDITRDDVVELVDELTANEIEFDDEFSEQSVFKTAMDDMAVNDVKVLDDECTYSLKGSADFYDTRNVTPGCFYFNVSPIEFAIRKHNETPTPPEDKLSDTSSFDDSEDGMVIEYDDTDVVTEHVRQEYPNLFNATQDGISDEILKVVNEEVLLANTRQTFSTYLRVGGDAVKCGKELIYTTYNSLLLNVPYDIANLSIEQTEQITDKLLVNLETPIGELYELINNKDTISDVCLMIHVLLISESIILTEKVLTDFNKTVLTSIDVNKHHFKPETVDYDGQPRIKSYDTLKVYGFNLDVDKVNPDLGFGNLNLLDKGDVKSIKLKQLIKLAKVCCFEDHQACGDLADDLANVISGGVSTITHPNEVANKIVALAKKGVYTDNHYAIYTDRTVNQTINDTKSTTMELVRVKVLFEDIGITPSDNQIKLLTREIGYNLLQTELMEIKAYADYTLISAMFARYAYYCIKHGVEYTCFTRAVSISNVIETHTMTRTMSSYDKTIALLYVATKTMFLLHEFFLNVKQPSDTIAVNGSERMDSALESDPLCYHDIKTNRNVNYLKHKGLIKVSPRGAFKESGEFDTMYHNSIPELMPVHTDNLLTEPFVINTYVYNNTVCSSPETMHRVAVANGSTNEEQIKSFLKDKYEIRHADVVNRIVSRKLSKLPIEEQNHMKYVFLSDILSSVMLNEQGVNAGDVQMYLSEMYTKAGDEIHVLANSANMAKHGTIYVNGEVKTNLISNDNVDTTKAIQSKKLITSALKAVGLYNAIAKDVFRLDTTAYPTAESIIEKDLL